MMRVISAAIAFALASAAVADEGAIRRMIEGKLPGAKVQSVQKLPVSGLYEVVVAARDGPAVYYVDDKATAIFVGDIFEAKSGRNITEERKRKLSAIRWDSLPFEWAVTSKRGDGRRKIAIFSDPNCPFCKRFEKDLAKLDDITIHIFLYPVIKQQSVTLTRSVWCSKDRAKAWDDLMLRDIQPAAAPDCETPIQQIVELGRKLGAKSTPTWFLENGDRHQGANPLAEVTRLLDAASPAKR